MAIKIYPVKDQVKGNFNDGEIMENKPIQITPDKTKLQPYSNLFTGHMHGQKPPVSLAYIHIKLLK